MNRFRGFRSNPIRLNRNLPVSPILTVRIRPSLLSAQSCDGVEIGGFDRRQPAGQDGDDRQQRDGEGQGCEIVGFKAKEHGGGCPPGEERERRSKTTPASNMAAVSRMTRAITCQRLAPSAMRMPISLRRRVMK